MEGEISKIQGTTRSKTVLQLALKRYKRTIIRNDHQYPERAWDAAATCACEKDRDKRGGRREREVIPQVLVCDGRMQTMSQVGRHY